MDTSDRQSASDGPSDVAAAVAPTGLTGPAGRIFVGVVVATCGAYAAVTMAPVVAFEATGSAFLSGLPVAALLAGAGAGATPVAALIRRRGARTALVRTYLLGAGACLLCVAGATAGSFLLLLLGLLGIGAAHAANQLVRYVAAGLVPDARRPTMIGWMVWAQALGAVGGPLSLGPAGRVAAAAGITTGSAGFALGVLLFVAAATVHALGPGYRTATGPVETDAAISVPRSTWSLPAVQVALAAMVTGLVVMLLVMAVTPLHVHTAGHGMAAVGWIMGIHTFGMFGLAPIAGWAVRTSGPVPVIAMGVLVLAVATGTAASAPASPAVLGVALFALGFGWCLGFVGGSALLTTGLEPSVRASLQGRVEAITWMCGAGAAVISGMLLGSVGFGRLSLIAGLLLAAPVGVLLRYRGVRAPRPAV